MAKNVYNYDPDTLLFSGNEEARESPLEEGVYLLPANATFVAPPKLSDNQAARFISGAWIKVPSFQGQIFYDKTTKEAVRIETFGALDSNLTELRPPYGPYVWTGSKWEMDLVLYLEQAKSKKISEMAFALSSENLKGASITTEAGTRATFDTSDASKVAINSALSAYNAIGQVPDGYYWIDNDNNHVPFTLGDLKTLALAATGWASFDKFQKLKIAINACNNEMEVNKIVWS